MPFSCKNSNCTRHDFDTVRALTMHYKFCKHNSLNTTKKRKATTSALSSSLLCLDTNTELKSTYNTRSQINMSNLDFAGSINIQNKTSTSIVERNTTNKNASTFEEDFEDGIEDNIHTIKQAPKDVQLIEQEEQFQTKKSSYDISLHKKAEIDLLKILADYKCHNSAYGTIMKWASHWNSKNVFFHPTSSYTFHSRKKVMKTLKSRYDMDGMNPTSKVIQLTNDEISSSSIKITSFDFKQQVLSLLRDKELMNPANLVFENEPGIEKVPSNSNKNNISEIIHSDWYKCAQQHYEKEKGHDESRVICGIILAIDKTHTDNHGNLCLEGINFTLSIFNTETRRSKYRAWRCLGFVNDLNANYDGKYDNKVSNMTIHINKLEYLFSYFYILYLYI